MTELQYLSSIAIVGVIVYVIIQERRMKDKA